MIGDTKWIIPLCSTFKILQVSQFSNLDESIWAFPQSIQFEKFIVSHALNCLSVDFSQIKTTHNTIGEKLTINDLITKCVAEEEKLKKEKSDIALLSVHTKPSSGKGNWKHKKNTSSTSHKN